MYNGRPDDRSGRCAVSGWQLLDSFGIFVFALSGGLAAARRQLDPFGFLVLAFLPAVGGGTLRDLLLDLPVFWLEAPLPLYEIAAAALLTFFLCRCSRPTREMVVVVRRARSVRVRRPGCAAWPPGHG